MRSIHVIVSSLMLVGCAVLSPGVRSFSAASEGAPIFSAASEGVPSVPAALETFPLVREGRWLQYNGQYQYFVGFDNQELVADTSIDYIAVLDTLRDVRVNKIRIWLDAYWDPSFLHPWARRNDKYDLDQWNLAYWQRLRDFMSAAHDRGIIVEVSLFPVYPADPNWWGNSTFQIAWNEANNINGAFRSNSQGHFFPEFFDIYHPQVSATGKTMKDYQQALVDKVLLELGSYPNVLFEISNEFPGDFRNRGYIDQVYEWQNYWAAYLKQRTPQLVAVHAHDSSGPQTRGIQYYWDNPNIDILNFHFYTDVGAVGGLLRSSQLKGKVLQSNESFNYQQDGSHLDLVTREAWGFFTAGAYYGFYHEKLLDAASISKLTRLTALRTIAESVRFWEMSPADAAGNEYDDLVSAGPASNWQVYANPGIEYVVYYWGNPTHSSARIQLPAGSYAYRWHDVRDALILVRGVVDGGDGVISIPAPERGWQGSAGTALVVQRTSSTSR